MLPDARLHDSRLGKRGKGLLETCTQLERARRKSASPSFIYSRACKVSTGCRMGCFLSHSPFLRDPLESPCFSHAAPKGSCFSLVVLHTADIRPFSRLFSVCVCVSPKEKERKSFGLQSVVTCLWVRIAGGCPRLASSLTSKFLRPHLAPTPHP